MTEKVLKGIERRYFIRVTSMLPVRFRVKEPGKKPSGREYEGVINNISTNGVSIELGNLQQEIWKKIGEGESNLHCLFYLPGSPEPLRVSGKAAHLTRQGEMLYYIGLIFTDIDDIDRAKVLRYIYTSKLRSSGRERRKFLRFTTAISVKYRILDDEDPRKSAAVYEGLIKNLSIDGLSIEIGSVFEEAWERIGGGERSLDMEFLLPGNPVPVKAQGESMHLQKEGDMLYYVGVIFTMIHDEDKERILTHLREKFQKSGED